MEMITGSTTLSPMDLTPPICSPELEPGWNLPPWSLSPTSNVLVTPMVSPVPSTHWVIAIKAGTAFGRQCSAIVKSHTILLRRKYFRGRGYDCLDCREISDRRLNKIRCETCGSSIKVKSIGSKRYLLNVLKYLQRASAEPEVKNAAVGNHTSFDASWFGVGVPGNGSSTPKRQQDEPVDGEGPDIQCC